MGQRTEAEVEFDAIYESSKRERMIVMRSTLLWEGRRYYVVERSEDGWWRARKLRKPREKTPRGKFKTLTRERFSRMVNNANETQLDRWQVDEPGWYERHEDALAQLEPNKKRRGKR